MLADDILLRSGQFYGSSLGLVFRFANIYVKDLLGAGVVTLESPTVVVWIDLKQGD
jgi:hypothetical protein